ncbi:histidinol dehydrogenase [Anaerovorax sp. IOR16]|uniref:histidinol dehydrogenase n=1 Tax=Anaerovorax sp. IOR16 TaxID=2773458 RepID=UPI0019D2A708|nr:histidinol dehydrogenase [Anaerovorax sp. IOR16]
MIQIYERDKISLEDVLDRERKQNEDVSELVDEIIYQVRKKKDAALFEYEKRFDKVELKDLAVTEQEIQTALNNIDPIFLNTLKMASENIKHFHRRQIRTDFIINDKEGVIMGQKITPIAKAGIYVPGGTASYPSSVLMNAIPAKLAGVKEIIMVTPPDKEGRIADSILAAASIAGVTKIFKIGGAQAIAALAYGTESIPKVDKIVGPGNIFVATAKSKVFGLVDIDMIAGPSEILVIADKTCNPSFVAADLLSQAEHDRLASAILVTNSMDLAKKVQDEIERQVSLLPREEIARASIDSKGKILLTASLEEAIEIANDIAPEHLEICVDDPFSLLSKVKNAGSIFLGKYAPEALGDYFAGPNHVLPTSGTARFSSPLSVDDFIKKSSYLYYTKEALENVKDQISDFANREGLSAHAKSITVRFEEV